MKTMHLFRISYQDLGDIIEILPEVPKYRLPEEDGTVLRVCAATTIFQCLQSKNSYLDFNLWTDEHRTIYIYEADIPIEDIEQPSIDQVEDTWFTGEFWVTKTHAWKKVGKYILELGERIYAKEYMYRYYVRADNRERAQQDRKEKYGFDGEVDSFFFIEAGPTRKFIEVKKNLINK